MLVVCPLCLHHGNINDKLIPEQGKNITCPKCKKQFFIKKPQSIHGGQPHSSLEKAKNSMSDTDSTEYTQTIIGETDMLHLICPGCGAALEKPEKLKGNIFQCEHCKNVVVIKEVSGEPKQTPQNILELALFSEKTGDYIQAYRHYSRLIEIDPKNPAYWMGKARNAGYMSSFQNQRIDEMLESFHRAISLAKEDEKEALRKDAGEFIFQRCCNYLNALKSTHTLYITQIINGMIQASEYLPYDLDIVDTIINTCKTKLSPFSLLEIREYKKNVLNRFMEKKKELFPEYFVHIEETKQKYSQIFDSLIWVSILFLISLLFAIFLIKIFE